jgi:hypothetical protein
VDAPDERLVIALSDALCVRAALWRMTVDRTGLATEPT